jgi:hypothetical protein
MECTISISPSSAEARSSVFGGVRMSVLTLYSGQGRGARSAGAMVSGNAFAVLWLHAAEGRLLNPADD